MMSKTETGPAGARRHVPTGARRHEPVGGSGPAAPEIRSETAKQHGRAAAIHAARSIICLQRSSTSPRRGLELLVLALALGRLLQPLVPLLVASRRALLARAEQAGG
jgi:hypothetical protein